MTHANQGELTLQTCSAVGRRLRAEATHTNPNSTGTLKTNNKILHSIKMQAVLSKINLRSEDYDTEQVYDDGRVIHGHGGFHSNL